MAPADNPGSSGGAIFAGSSESSPLLASEDYEATDHFAEGDSDNPRNWPAWRKWLIVAVITPIDLSVSWGASGFSPATSSLQTEFGLSETVATLGLSLYILGLAFGPMSLAPLSEFFGRSVIYIGSYAVFLVLLAATALVRHVAGFMVLRFFSGLFAAVTIANFGGTIADMWKHHETGIAMSIYLWAATCGSPSGFFIMSFVAEYRGWREVFWALLGICGSFWLLMSFTLSETRHTTILRRRAKAQRRSDSDALKSMAPGHRSAHELFHVALTRPFRFLFTEAIVIFGAMYNGYLYGLSFLFNGAFRMVFGEGHGFSTVGVGCAFLGIAAGISIGPFTNLWQERYYQRRLVSAGNVAVPEARLQLAMIAAVVFPISMFWFAWTTSNDISPIVPIIASGFWGWSFYTLILMTLQYTEDAYGVFSASALAGIGLVRNIAGAAFPLFGRHLFEKLGYQWGASLLAFLSIALIPIPFILVRSGSAIRKKSPWANQHIDDAEDDVLPQVE